MNQTPNFTVQPETRALNITKDHTAEVSFLVTSRMALRGEAHVIPVAVNSNRDPLETAQFAPWLTLVGEREVAFAPSGEAKSYTVRITVPDDADPGEYSFRLKVVDVAEPDETVGESPEILFQVIGPKPSLAGFVVAAVLALLILAGLAVWAVLTVQNQTNLQITVTREGESVQLGKPVTYAVQIENRRLSAVDGVRLRYALPDGVIGAYAAVEGAITRHCDKLNRGRTIFCDLGAVDAEASKTIRFVLIPDPNWLAGMNEVTETLEGDDGFVAWLRGFFTSSEVIAARKLVGNVENIFQLSGHRITAREVDSSFTVERCLAIEIRRDGELLQQRTCPEQAVWVSLDPDITEATLNEIQRYTIRVWNEHTDQAAGVVVRYQLPERLRYIGEIWPPTLDPACTPEQYFTVACKLTLAPASQATGSGVDLQEFVLQLSSTSAGALANAVAVTGILTSTLQITDTTGATTTQIITKTMAPITNQVATTNMNTALRFDGIDDWVELGYTPGKPTEFSVEMWIHPFSYDNGQAFVGAHTEDGQNVFLVGYWPASKDEREGLLVNLFGDDQVIVPIEEIKQGFAQDYHLTVTVKELSSADQYDVTVYLYNKETNETRIVGPRQFTAQVATENLQYRSWVLGQDWDQGSPAPHTSDFFKGTMREVRIWRKALDETQVRCVRANRFYVDPTDGSLVQVGDFGADCVTFSSQAKAEERPQLAGYWRLDGPLNREEPIAVANLARSLDGASPQPASLHGGTNWGGIDPRFGAGLLFDGINDYVSGVSATGILSLTASLLLSDTGAPTESVAALSPQVAPQQFAPANDAPTEAQNTSEDIGATEQVTTTETVRTPVTATASNNTVMASLATWLYVADGIPTERQWIAGVVGAEVSMALMLNENGQVMIVAGCGQVVVQMQDSKTVPINRWVHYAGVMALTCADLSTSTLSLYRDGSLVNQARAVAAPADVIPPWAGCPANVYLGGLGANQSNAGLAEGEQRCINGWPFKGRIDEVRIWNRALSREEVPRWRNRPGEQYDELAYWSFSEGAGNLSQNAVADRYQLQVVGPNWIDTNFDLAGQDAGP